MRTKFKDVVENYRVFPEWWLDTPWKRLHNWRTLLFEPGRGWLRWGLGEYTYTEVIDSEIGGPTFPATCAPPLRRVWLPIRMTLQWLFHGFGWYKHPEFGWERLTWQEWGTPNWKATWEELKDPDWPEWYVK